MDHAQLFILHFTLQTFYRQNDKIVLIPTSIGLLEGEYVFYEVIHQLNAGLGGWLIGGLRLGLEELQKLKSRNQKSGKIPNQLSWYGFDEDGIPQMTDSHFGVTVQTSHSRNLCMPIPGNNTWKHKH